MIDIFLCVDANGVGHGMQYDEELDMMVPWHDIRTDGHCTERCRIYQLEGS